MKKAKILFTIAGAILFLSSFFINPHNNNELSFSGEPKNKEQLGEALFFDRLLSADSSISCASCHIPAFAFADTVALSKGVGGRLGKRNAPTCMNIAGRDLLFYDGRAASLEDQVRFPIEDHNEMNLPIAEAVNRLNRKEHYVRLFAAIFNSKPTEASLKEAIASFERTLETSKTPFDRYMAGNDSAISASAIRGRELFMGPKAKCFECHFSPDFTGDEFKNIGLFDGKQYNDSGRYSITKDKKDIGKFKVPGLRNVAVTAPYMHNGMFRTIRQVIDYYNNPYKIVQRPVNTDSLLTKPLGLTETEITDLENFLLTLTDDRFAKATPLKK